MILLNKRIKQEIKKLELFLDIKKTKLVITVKNRNVKITFDSEVCARVHFLELNKAANAVQKQNVEFHWVTLHWWVWIENKKARTLAWQLIIFFIATYGCERWTMKKLDREKINSFKMRGWRKLLSICWTARVTSSVTYKTRHITGKQNPQYSTLFIWAMPCDQTHWKRHLWSEWSVKMGNGVSKKTWWLDTIKADTR